MLAQMSLALLGAISAASALPHVEIRAEECSGSFRKVSAADWVKNSNPGWNVGNTLDAIPDEGSWNNPPVVASTFDTIKSSGYKGIRIPVTWADHYVSDAPDFTIDPAWLQRVEDVVDISLARGFYTIVNVHHDSWNWADLTNPSAYADIEAKFYSTWYQIATQLGCKSQLLAFETINEPTGDTQEAFDELNKLQQIFLNAIADAGGYNKDRVVTLVGPGEDSIKTSVNFVKPENFTNPYAIQFHYYSPYDFVFSAWGKTIWGSDADVAAMEADFANVRGNFTDVPLLVGEWSASSANPTETAARWKYVEEFVRLARKYNVATFVWDNGADSLNRATGEWRDQVAQDLIISATKGNSNALPESEEDGSALTQFSDAYIYHKVGEPVEDATLSYELNGNTVKSVRSPSGSSLKKGAEYVVDGADITYKAALLSKYISPDAAPGSKANFTIDFNRGVYLTAEVVQWDTPELGSASESASAAAASGGDLHIPVTWKGINRLATVKATLPSGVCLFDTWTEYLPATQQCRMTFNNQWNWDGESVILTAATVQAAVSAGENIDMVFEFYPRTPENTVDFTLTA